MIKPSTSSLDSAQRALLESVSRLSSGSRIMSAKDNPAGSVLAAQMSVQLSSAGKALSNIDTGISLTQTAAGGLAQVSDTLQRLRELAVQSANGSNSPSDRQALQAEFSQLSGSLDGIAGQLQFNGKNVLDGSLSTTLQSGPNGGETRNLTLGSVSSRTLGVASLDITTESGSSSALDAIDQALASVGKQQASIGAVQSGLEAARAYLGGNQLNLAATRSTLAETDYATESGNLASTRIMQQASLRALALYNANQGQTLDLLPKSNLLG